MICFSHAAHKYKNSWKLPVWSELRWLSQNSISRQPSRSSLFTVELWGQSWSDDIYTLTRALEIGNVNDYLSKQTLGVDIECIGMLICCWCLTDKIFIGHSKVEEIWISCTFSIWEPMLYKIIVYDIRFKTHF